MTVSPFGRCKYGKTSPCLHLTFWSNSQSMNSSIKSICGVLWLLWFCSNLKCGQVQTGGSQIMPVKIMCLWAMTGEEQKKEKKHTTDIYWTFPLISCLMHRQKVLGILILNQTTMHALCKHCLTHNVKRPTGGSAHSNMREPIKIACGWAILLRTLPVSVMPEGYSQQTWFRLQPYWLV